MGPEEEIEKMLRLQVARWKAVLGDTEELLDSCVHAEDQLNDLIERCAVPQGSDRANLESSQEAMIRTRMSVHAGNAGFGVPRRKTIRERKNELMELRHELAKVDDNLGEAAPSKAGNSASRIN